MSGMSDCQMIYCFNETGGAPVKDHPSDEVLKNLSLVEFRHSLINEEYHELLSATSRQDILDALADLCVVIYGYANVTGLSLQSLTDFRRMTFDYSYQDLIDLVTRFNSQLGMYSLDELESYLTNMLKACYSIAGHYTLNLCRGFYRVHTSNMSKFCSTVEEAERSVKAYEGDTRYSDVRFKVVGDLYVIYDHKTSKILKGVNYLPPRLEDLV